MNEFNLEERLEKFRKLFLYTYPEYNKGWKQQKQNYVDYMKEEGKEDTGVRGINSFGIKLVRRPVYIKNGQETYNAPGYPDHYEYNLVLAPKMEEDPSVDLKLDEHYKSIPILIGCPYTSERIEAAIMEPVQEIFLMTNAEVMQRFNLRYPFTPEMLERLGQEDEEIVHNGLVQNLKASLFERIALEQQQQTGPGYTEPLVWE